MSQLDQFIESIKTDKDLLRRVYNAEDEATAVAIIVDEAKARGYDFTTDDVQERMNSHKDGQLSESDLAQVTGGENFTSVVESWARDCCG